MSACMWNIAVPQPPNCIIILSCIRIASCGNFRPPFLAVLCWMVAHFAMHDEVFNSDIFCYTLSILAGCMENYGQSIWVWSGEQYYHLWSITDNRLARLLMGDGDAKLLLLPLQRSMYSPLFIPYFYKLGYCFESYRAMRFHKSAGGRRRRQNAISFFFLAVCAPRAF